jgi:hypothetical protein
MLMLITQRMRFISLFHRKMDWIIALLLIICSLQEIAAQSIEASLDTAKMIIGDRRQLVLQARVPEGFTWSYDGSVLLDSTGWFIALDTVAWDTTATDGLMILTKSIDFTVLDSGQFLIPELPMAWNSPTGVVKKAISEPLVLDVTLFPVLWPPASIETVIFEPTRWQDYLIYVYGAIALALAIWFVSWFFRRRQKRIEAFEALVIPPDRRAIIDLEALKTELPTTERAGELFQTKLSFVVRRYLNEQFDLDALEASTEAIDKTVSQSGLIGPEPYQALITILRQADLVKFAKQPLPQTGHLAQVDAALQFIEATRPISPLSETAPTDV